MSQLEELAEVDAAWQSLGGNGNEPFARTHELSMRSAFGHARDRRLGLRVASNCWALLRGRLHSVYAVAVELSATGVILKLVGRGGRITLHPTQRFGLDLFVPGASSPVRVVVRPVRPIGELEAFEFVESTPVDRLTLAEYLDRLLTQHDENPAESVRLPSARSVSQAAPKTRLRPGAVNSPRLA